MWSRPECSMYLRRAAVSDFAEQSKDIVVLALADALKDVLGFGLGARLDVGDELAHFGSLSLEHLISAAQGRPAAFALLGFVDAIGA